MTTEISTYIEQIKTKVSALHQKLDAERLHVGSLTEEISRLNSAMSQIQNTVDEQAAEILSLKAELAEKREQVQVSSEVQMAPAVSPVEIDMLVKEIDFCIQQLKIANE